jgi:hypothetical protein
MHRVLLIKWKPVSSAAKRWRSLFMVVGYVSWSAPT